MKYFSKVVSIGNLLIGGHHPIRIQSMTNTDTMDTEATVAQTIRMIKAGSELVRITVPGVKEAENLKEIKKRLNASGYYVPLIADIHYNPKAAEVASSIVEKVRINPGNYIGKQSMHYSDSEYIHELEVISNNLKPLIDICKQHGTAIRIGVNQGSLGNRIVERFGDTVDGMVASALEYARICSQLDFHNLVISVKSSNTVTMVNAYKQLAIILFREHLNYPLHVGVTEAGEGKEGRMKSIAGAGAVLAHGIGDTIRVSLTEDPELELPVARDIVKHFSKSENGWITERKVNKNLSITDLYIEQDSFLRRTDRELTGGFPGSDDPPVVLVKTTNNYLLASPDGKHSPLSEHYFLVIDKVPAEDTLSRVIENIREHKARAFIFQLPAETSISMIRQLRKSGCKKPVMLMSAVKCYSVQEVMTENSLHPGTLLLLGYGQGICIDAADNSVDEISNIGFGILQATRTRITETEYISCPSCGRTHFDIQKRLKEVKQATAGFTGLKIAVMGCIVNGPGEMADADFGYVGAGKGKVNLYKGKVLIKQGVTEESAVDELLELIQRDRY